MNRLLDRLERYLRPFALPHLTEGLIACQVLVYFVGMGNPEALLRLLLIPALVLDGEVWRLVTFAILPPGANPIFILFFWYMFYLMGTALEQFWGTFRYNLFFLIGYVATVAASFAQPLVPASNAFLEGSVFLAFAFLYPDFQLYLFFILPVKIKWLALLTWLGYLYLLIFGSWEQRLMVLASVSNFLVFFAPDLFSRARYARRRMSMQVSQFTQQNRPHHRCTVCGITDQSHPRMEFRYCSQCEGNHAYCADHLRNHEHIKAPEGARDRTT